MKNNMKNTTFTGFLMDKYMDSDNSIPNLFDLWILKLTARELIEYADEFAELRVIKAEQDLLKAKEVKYE